MRSTRPTDDSGKNQKAWHFPYALLVDRSAAHRGVVCGSQTQRTAAEAWQYMLTNSRLVGVHAGRWWDPIREAMWRFAGVNSPDAVSWMSQHGQSGNQAQAELGEEREVTPDLVRAGTFQSLLPTPKRIVISYISRQPSRGRKLTSDSHHSLVKALLGLVERRNVARTDEGEPEWEFKLVVAESLTKDEQIQMAARTTVSFSCRLG